MEAAYFQAAIPEPFRILGLALKPLSLGRYRLLKRFGCGFVAEEETKPRLNDLVIGVLISSMECAEFGKWLTEEDCQEQVAQWSRKVGEFDLDEKFKLFQDYIRTGSKLPAYWAEEGAGKVSGAHWSQSVEVTLRGQLGWTREEINEEPLTKALADYFKWAESQGLVELMS